MKNQLIRLAVVTAGLSSIALGQSANDEAGRGVARISLLNGDVSIRRGDSGDYVAAAVNAPLVVGDRVVTGAGSRSELQFDWANMLRISHHAEVRLAELENQRYIVQIARGTVTWRVLREQDAYVEVSTPSVSVRPVKKGTYRITVLEDGSSEITVRSGEAEIFTPKGSERLKSGRTMFARGTASDPEFRIGDDIPMDDWDRWNERRDQDLLRTQSYNYISRDIYGADDLDNHGRWVYDQPYGWVWSPRVAVGWAPYRYGRWSWVDWYGWSWVSSDPWGWAPYHYGRWYCHANYGWVWHPGGMHARHRWAPGYVAFVGYGGGFGVSVGFGWGRVGWIPLAPYEPYHPWYGSRWYGGYRNRTYIDNSVTVVNNVNITNVYRNARVNNGYTVVDGDGFRNGRVGQPGRFTDAEWRQASVAQGPVPITPGRESLRMADREASVRGTEVAGRSDRFYSSRQPAAVNRVSFDDQRRGVEQIARRAYDPGGSPAGSGRDGSVPTTLSGRSGSSGTQTTGRGTDTGSSGAPAIARGFDSSNSTPATSGTPGARSAERSEETSRGWRRAGEPPAGTSGSATPTPGSATTPARSGGDSGSGWQRFGSARVSDGGGSSTGRFGEPSAPQASPDANRSTPSRSSGSSNDDRTSSTGRSSSDGWTRFGSSTRSGTSDSSAGESRSGEARPSDRGTASGGNSSRGDSTSSGRTNFSGRSSGNSGGSEGIRISPPIVRERSSGGGSSSPSFSRGSDGSGGGRSGGSPSFSAPSSRGSDGGGRSAPSAAPSRGSGGGGGGGGTSGGRGSGSGSSRGR